MKNILLLGAGKSATILIEYLLQHAQSHQWHLTIADADVTHILEKTRGLHHAASVSVDASNAEQLSQLVSEADIVVSMLPAAMHPMVAEICVAEGKHLLTASYISPQMQALDEAAKQKGVLLLNEMGLDPGIDHLSAMQMLDKIKAEGGVVTSFKSFCGGLMAPDSNTNPWGYKFTWNPRNVVLAGQSTARYIENSKLKFIPYTRLFTHLEEFTFSQYGRFEGYPNRDSMLYSRAYGLEDTKTMLRGTLRYPNFCQAWACLVNLGLTDDSFAINTNGLRYIDIVEALLPKGVAPTLPAIAKFLNIDEDGIIMQMLVYTGIFSTDPIAIGKSSPAQILQHLLEDRWKLAPTDLDLVLLAHEVEYHIGNQHYKHTATLAVKGNDSLHTAMAKTVGLPLGIAAKLLLTGKLHLTGVQMPLYPSIYNPVLTELAELGITFEHQISTI